MTSTNPMGGSNKALTEIEDLAQDQSICSKLSEIFVDKMQVAHQISLEIDPETGEKEYHFVVDFNSAIPDQLVEHEIKGIPVKFSYTH